MREPALQEAVAQGALSSTDGIEAFLRLISPTSARLAQASGDSLPAEVDACLRNLMEFFTVDQCGIMEIQADVRQARLRHVVSLEDVQRAPTTIEYGAMFPWTHAKTSSMANGWGRRDVSGGSQPAQHGASAAGQRTQSGGSAADRRRGPTGALVGERLVFGRAVYSYKVLEAPYGLYVGGSIEAGRIGTPPRPEQSDRRSQISRSVPRRRYAAGALCLGYGWTADGNRSAYLYLGRP